MTSSVVVAAIVTVVLLGVTLGGIFGKFKSVGWRITTVILGGTGFLYACYEFLRRFEAAWNQSSNFRMGVVIVGGIIVAISTVILLIKRGIKRKKKEKEEQERRQSGFTQNQYFGSGHPRP